MSNELIIALLSAFAVPVATALAGYIVKLVNAKAEAIKAKTNQEKINHYIDILNDTVCDVVVSLNQTTVEKFKEAAADGKLTPEEVKEIKEDAMQTVFNILGNAGISTLELAFDDLESLIASKIERAVTEVKVGE